MAQMASLKRQRQQPKTEGQALLITKTKAAEADGNTIKLPYVQAITAAQL